jgi:Putative DNA-binding domain
VPISADKVRELAARGARTTLAFRQEDYRWAAGKSASAELARDLMALANVLGPSASPAYILIGVQHDGTIVGVPPASHLDNAALRQKVKELLNKVPQFSYRTVEVDGLSVGVYEIMPGGRPYFPLRDAEPALQKHVAKYRDGTATETVSPSMVLEWHREDDRQPSSNGASADHAQPAAASSVPGSASLESVHRERVRSGPGGEPSTGDPRTAEQRRLVQEIHAAHRTAHERLRRELGFDDPGRPGYVPAMAVMGDPAERALRDLLAEQVTLDGFAERARHVLAVAEAEARRERSLRWFGASLWSVRSYGRAVSMAVGEDPHPVRPASITTGRVEPLAPEHYPTGVISLEDHA